MRLHTAKHKKTVHFSKCVKKGSQSSSNTLLKQVDTLFLEE